MPDFFLRRCPPSKPCRFDRPLPPEIQNYTVYAASFGANAKESADAQTLLNKLSGSASAEVCSKREAWSRPARDAQLRYIKGVGAKKQRREPSGRLHASTRHRG
jgi:hypothetical protein